MSTGRKLAKRSIVGTRVCALAADGKYYTGVISAVNNPKESHLEQLGGLNITPSTRYAVRFDGGQKGLPFGHSATEYSGRELIGPGFGLINTARLVPGQTVYLTHNGREIQAEVVQHREDIDDVVVLPTQEVQGLEKGQTLTKKIDEVRLMESRKSARLADTDTDFARLADVGGSDRKRSSTSANIDVPMQPGHQHQIVQAQSSRKRRPSSGNDSDRSDHHRYQASSAGMNIIKPGEFMDECSAAMVLMSLSTSPNAGQPHLLAMNNNNSWDDKNSSSSSASWRTNTPSPNNLSDESGTGSLCSTTQSKQQAQRHLVQSNNQRYYHQQQHHHQQQAQSNSSGSPRTDEGWQSDLDCSVPPRKAKKMVHRGRVEPYDAYGYSRRSNVIIHHNNNNNIVADDNDMEDVSMPVKIEDYYETENHKPGVVWKCVWRPDNSRSVVCGHRGPTWHIVATHVLKAHLQDQVNVTKDNIDFYMDEEDPAELNHGVNGFSPPTKSHFDMARPRAEDPEYQEQIRLLVQNSNPQPTNQNNLMIANVISMAPQAIKQLKPSPGCKPLQAYNNSTSPSSLINVSVINKAPHSPRRVRGETKKCRKVYGMEHRDLWCTQCKWKKACTRFNDN